jgi:hypothetical protein
MKRAINRALVKTTGYQLIRTELSAKIQGRAHSRNQVNRLVDSPVFVMSSVRSGSTLLRVILNSHSQICAPHELHLRTLHVQIKPEFGLVSMKELGLDQEKLENLLWDRILHRELIASGKKIIVDKTPNMVFAIDRLNEAWPKARYVYLLRHPGGIADSLIRAREEPNQAEIVKRVLEYVDAIDKARTDYPGPVVKYEELTNNPATVMRGLCQYLGVPWEPQMLNYGDFHHGKLKPDIIVPTEDQIPPELLDACRSWGYL